MVFMAGPGSFVDRIGDKNRALALTAAQLLVFAVFTLAFIVFTRPLALKFLETKDTQQCERLIGQYGIVTQAISPFITAGQGKRRDLDGNRSEDIEVDARIRVVGIEGLSCWWRKPPGTIAERSVFLLTVFVNFILLVFVVGMLFSSIRIIRQSSVGIVERLGKFQKGRAGH